jgi:hypothetical protein
MRALIFFVALVAAQTVFAQKFTIQGHLLDSAGAPLPSATVLLLNPKDSSLVNFGTTNTQGLFELKNVARAEYLFKVTYVGFRPLMKKITPPAEGESIVNLGQLRMEVHSSELNEVVVTAERAPVVVKKDTIEFNATAFKTQENATVEDLLKKLPGVEVDKDGNIDAQGERVQRVTVDGREFFGRDPKIATRNLPADAVDKVQIYDKKSDQAAFTGIDDGQREKTVNLELKEEKRNGAFGSLMAGAGTNDRYNAKLSINRFGKTRQMSVIGTANNINEQGFSIDDYMNFSGGSQQLLGGGGMVRVQIGGSSGGSDIPLNLGGRNSGIMTNYAGGVNFNNDFSSKTKLSSNYFVNYLDHNLLQSTYRENFRPDGNLLFTQDSRQNSTNENHRLNLILDHQIDSANSLKFTNGFTYNQTDSEQESFSRTTDAEGVLQNTSDQKTSSTGSTVRYNGELLLRHRFQTKGRTLSANLTLGITNTDRDGLITADNQYENPMIPDQLISQRNVQKNYTTNYGVNLSYTEPLGNRKYLEVNYNISRNQNEVTRDVYDQAEESETLNTLLSNEYNSYYQYQRGGLNFRVNRKNFSLTAGTSFQSTRLNGDLTSVNQDTTIDRTFENILPVFRFNYEFSSTKRLTFDYETSVQEPTIQQLQPVIDNSDPLNISQGNPNLRPAYQQSWRLNYNMFNPVSFVNFFSFITADYQTNAITTSQSFGEGGARTTQPVNAGTSFSLSGNASFSFPITKIGSRVSIGTNYRNSKSITLIDDSENGTLQDTYGGSLRYSFRFKEILDISLSSQLSYQVTRYDFDQPNQTYLNQTHNAQSTVSFLKKYQFVADFDYLVYESQTSDFSQSIPFLNLSVSRFMLKNKAGELKLSVNNLLDKNLGVSQTATANYFQLQTINSLGRYFMVSFTYALNKHLNPMGPGPGRAGFRMIRG